LFDGARAGADNMALDEALGETAAESRVPVLRFYTWIEPTLSLGYFQSLADRDEHLPSRAAAVVRRASGGGAILHDRELTYSLALPCSERDVGDAAWLYRAVHQALVDTLAEWQVLAAVRAEPGHAVPSGPVLTRPREPFLCFQRAAAGDVVLGGMKIAGSAQRRRRGALLQHGSVLLARSNFAPELPGILELASVRITPAELGKRWFARLLRALDLTLDLACLTPAEEARSAVLVAEKYGNPTWTAKR
jgi:lipoate-protein ligase A